MNYGEQTRFLDRYRVVAAAGAAVFVLLFARAAWVEWARTGAYGIALAALLVAATVYGACYLPLYLRISIEAQKRYAWGLRARYVLVAVLAVAAIPALTSRDRWLVWAAAVAIEAVALVAARAYLKRNRNGGELPLLPLQLLLAELAIVLLAASLRPAGALALAAGLALAAMVYAASASRAWHAAGLVAAAIALGLVLAAVPLDWAAIAMVAAAAATTVALARRADARHALNVAETVDDLASFALVTPEHAAEMLATSTGILARNWNDTRPVGPDAVARWYEENSEYYLYDLAQFHLAYKHIAFMRDVGALARGRVLDFGAGIGDLALELARLGHETVYVDVEGRTKAFAAWRAERDWIPVRFASELEELEGEFDTIVSLDVFEHLAEPEPVIDALVERLAPGGRMIVTAAFGATKAHPMHFDHDLDLGRFLASRGLVDAKTFRMRHLASEFLGKPNVLVYERP